ncbi:very-short-patch-repair endonuclease [Mesorhizobium robiniae]|uniref:Very-short-patch-repair endonuclease n=1 Tax=Mesorhizobium robiniae TaxID=559315 RepID=A0ABV2GI25_9HYPH
MRQKARALRVHATKGESLLWYELRELKSGGFKFRRQCPIGPYIVDFACLAVKLVVEVDGDLHEQERDNGMTLSVTPICDRSGSISFASMSPMS